MKRIQFILIVLLITAVVLSGCDIPYGNTTQHTFLHSREDVAKVEICTNNDLTIWQEGSNINSLILITTLSNEEIDLLWAELLSFSAYECNFISHGCGDLLFVISYANGEQELIGFGEIGIINPDGTFCGYRSHVLGDNALLAHLFSQYGDADILAKASMSFRANYVADESLP